MEIFQQTNRSVRTTRKERAFRGWMRSFGDIARRSNTVIFSAAMVLLTMNLICPNNLRASDTSTALEYQVKAAFLINFPKYVDWPEEAFATTNSSIVLGVMGDSKIGTEVQKSITGRSFNGRAISMKIIGATADLADCQILFVSASQKSHFDEILNKAAALPILTVGEHDQFLSKGGIINFILKDGKVRLEINLNAARRAKVQISSKLLSVADAVKGKSN